MIVYMDYEYNELRAGHHNGFWQTRSLTKKEIEIYKDYKSWYTPNITDWALFVRNMEKYNIDLYSWINSLDYEVVFDRDSTGLLFFKEAQKAIVFKLKFM